MRFYGSVANLAKIIKTTCAKFAIFPTSSYFCSRYTPKGINGTITRSNIRIAYTPKAHHGGKRFEQKLSASECS